MTKWIDSKEGLLTILKHGPDIAKEYQLHLDDDIFSPISWDEEGALDFDTWLEEFKNQIEWENSDEFKSMIESNRGNH